MIISVSDLQQLIDCKEWSEERLERKLRSIEQTIRSYTNNNFQNRRARSVGAVVAQRLYLAEPIPGLDVDDTIQVSESYFNDGVYTVGEIDGRFVDPAPGYMSKKLVDESQLLITKVEYPADVVDCAINLMAWEIENRSKVGVKSETISRHSVTYYDQDTNNQINGYPVSLLGCLERYRKARC